VVRIPLILVFFDSNASCYLIPGKSLDSYSILMCVCVCVSVDILWELAQKVRISIESGIVILI